MSTELEDTRFCPVHGDYRSRGDDTACPRCADDPIAARHSLRSVKVVTAEAPPTPSDSSANLRSGDEAPTPIDDLASCPSCGKKHPLDAFQSEALGEVWEGEAALWAEDGVCRDCYRDVLPNHSRRWTTEEWVAHHFEGWRLQVARVHELEVHEESDQDGWLPDEERQRILDVSGTLSARREHLARANMRLRDIKHELSLPGDPPQFVEALEDAARALGPAAVAELERRHQADLERERERRVASVTELSPAQLIRDAGLDPEEVIGPLARSTGSRRRVPVVPDFENVGPAPAQGPIWPIVVVVGAVTAFVLWWFLLRAGA